MAPRDEAMLVHMLHTALRHDAGPVAIRYPRGEGVGVPLPAQPERIPIGTGEILREGERVAIVGYGTGVGKALGAADLLAERGLDVTVADARFAKPLDTGLLAQLAAEHDLLVTVEEGVLTGGFGTGVWEALSEGGARAAHAARRPARPLRHARRAEAPARGGRLHAPSGSPSASRPRCLDPRGSLALASLSAQSTAVPAAVSGTGASRLEAAVSPSRARAERRRSLRGHERRWRHGVPVRRPRARPLLRPDLRPPTVCGAHQPGIATPQLDHLGSAALDVDAGSDLRALLAAGRRRRRAQRGGRRDASRSALGPGLFDGARARRHGGPTALRSCRRPARRARPGVVRRRPLRAGVRAAPSRRGACRARAARRRTASRCAGSQDAVSLSALRPATGPGSPRDVLGFTRGTASLRRGEDRRPPRLGRRRASARGCSAARSSSCGGSSSRSQEWRGAAGGASRNA